MAAERLPSFMTRAIAEDMRFPLARLDWGSLFRRGSCERRGRQRTL